MLKNVLCGAFVLAMSASLAMADEKKADAKPEAKPEAKPAAVFIPRELQGTPAAKRLTEIQAEIDALMPTRVPARQEADKARHLAMEAEHKADVINRTITGLEQEKTRIINNGIAQSKEAAMQKAAFENAQKITKLEMQVRDLTARLEANSRPKIQPASIQHDKDTHAQRKPEPAKKAEPEKKQESEKKDSDKK